MSAPTGSLLYVDLQNEVITYRFKEAQRGSVKRWINHRYGWVWAQGPWPFKQNATTDVTVTAGSFTAAYATATDVLRPLNVYNQNGDPLNYLTPREFQRFYEDTTGTGMPEDYTVINGVIYLGPKANANYTYAASYERKLSHYSAADTYTVGPLSADGDYPIYAPEYHYGLVLGAMATGLKLVNDPTWTALEDEFRAMIEVMKQELLPADRGESIQFGSLGNVTMGEVT